MPERRTYYYIMDDDYNIVRRFPHRTLGVAFAGLAEVLRQAQRGDTFLLVSTKGPFTRSKPLYCHARAERLEDAW